MDRTLSSEETKHDQQFYDRFLIILGALLGVTVFLFVISRWIGVDELNKSMQNDPAYQAAVGARILPVAKVAIAGQDYIFDGPEVVIYEGPEILEAIMTGPQVYIAICGACHGPGLAGAPMTGDTAAWSARVNSGIESMNNNAINGYQGDAGFMPAKGGRTDLSDDEIIAAVQYMVDQL